MKILYIHQYFNTDEMPGSTRSFEFAKRLTNNGNSVYMITSNWQKLSDKKFTTEAGIKVYWGSSTYSNKMNYLRRIISFTSFAFFALRKGLSLDYDLIIASSTPLTVGIPAVILKKIKKVKMVFEVRDMWPQLPIALGAIKFKPLIKILKWLEYKIYKESDKIIALSDGMKNEIFKICGNIEKIVVITNLCDIENFTISKAVGKNYKRKYLNFNSSPLILYAGSLGRINNVNYLVDIAKILQKKKLDIKILIVGDGHQSKTIEDRAKKLNLLNKNLFIMNFISKNKMPELLSAATIVSSLFIDLPEMENNSANKFFDGLAAGKPLMLNYGGWQSKLIKKNNAGFTIPNNNPKKASEIINKYIFDEEKIISMEDSSKKLSHSFSIEKNFLVFEKTLNSLKG